MSDSKKLSGKEDPELDDLLDDALPDFDKHTASSKKEDTSSVNQEQCKPKDGDNPATAADDLLCDVADDAAKQFEDAMKDLMDHDPQIMQQFEQLFQAAGNISAAPESQQEFSATLQQTLGSLSQNAQQLDPNDGEAMNEDELMRMMSGLGMGGSEGAAGGEELIPLMQTMMKSLMSKEVLYPSLKEISLKYPKWIEENEDKISEGDLSRYRKQLDLMTRICTQFDEESDTDSEPVKTQRFTVIMSLMQEMQDCGQPPKEIVGEMAPGLEFGSDGVPKIPGMDQCCVM